jgi:hypothetical protein
MFKYAKRLKPHNATALENSAVKSDMLSARPNFSQVSSTAFMSQAPIGFVALRA